MGKKSEQYKTICLVGCGKQKAALRAPAKDIYTSPFFRLKRQYAERFGDSWFIISAEHHLLKPDKEIDPYENTLKGSGVESKKSWAARVHEQLCQVVAPKDTLIILAGKDYFEHLLPFLQGVSVKLPLKGLKQGEQNKWLKDCLKEVFSHDSE